MGFIDDLKALLAQVENQSAVERETRVPQSTVSRIVSEFKDKGISNPTLKNLAPMIDHYGFKLVDPAKQKQVSEDEIRDKIANEVMKALLQSGHGDVAGVVFALITKTAVATKTSAQELGCGQRAAGGN